MKTGLVLEGGALRTIFSSGVCDAMLEHNARMADYVIGVSAGIAYGVNYVSKQPRRNLEVLTQYAGDRRYMGMRNLLDRRNRCYFGLEFSYETIPNKLIPFDYDAFAAFEGQVEAVVTNLDTGCAEYLSVPRRDEKFLVLQATCALPMMFPIYDLDGKPCMDGGASDSIPWERALSMGCDKIIVVMTRPRDYVKGPERMMGLIRRKYKAYPKFVAAMQNRAKQYNASRERLFQLEQQGKALVIAPKSTHGISRIERDKEKLRMLWGEGYQAAVERMDEIEQFLEQ